jgi:hypothetical protein
MKTHTQQQTNLKKETTATEPKLSSRKRSEYKPRKWRGNTLVPVVIGLAVSAIATVTFLNQGASLAADNKTILAQNEIATIVSSWNILRANYAIANIKNAPGQGEDSLNNLQIQIPSSILKVNVYGIATVYSENDTELAYTTENEESCKNIKISVDKMLGVSESRCSEAGTLTISLK